MVMTSQEVQDAGRAEHELISVGSGFAGRMLPRLPRAPVKERHQHIGNVPRAITPAPLPQHAIRLEIDFADARETVALTKAVTAQLRRTCAERSSQVLLRNGSSALDLRDAQPAECNAGRSVTPPIRGGRM